MSNTIYDPDDEDSIFPGSPTLQRVEPDLGPEKPIDLAPELPSKQKDAGQQPNIERPGVIPDLIPILIILGPNNPELAAQLDPSTYHAEPEEDWAMLEVAEDPEGAGFDGMYIP